jgi:ATP-dependent Clp protease ATP-binding subunit ClpC
MFDRFEDDARRVMGLSRQEAQRFCHDYIGTEHFLLGLVKSGRGVGLGALRNLRVNLDEIHRQVERRLTLGKSMVTMGQIPFTPQAKRVLELALEEAHDLGHDHIGTGHLLLGLLREPKGIAGRVLREMPVELAEAREQVRRLVSDLPPRPLDEPEKGALADRLRRLEQESAALEARLAALESRVQDLEAGADPGRT